MFVTLSEVKQYLSISTPTEDVKLQSLMDMQNEFIGDYTGIKDFELGSTIEIEDYQPIPNNRMIIDTENVDKINEVYVNGVLTSTTASLMRGYMVVFSQEIAGSIKLVCSLKGTRDNFQGLQALKVAAMELVKFYHKQEYKSQVSSGGESINYDTVSYLPSHVKSILNLYRR